MKTLIAFALIATAFTACKKEKKTTEDTVFSGTITISAPAENATITGGTSFLVTGTITGNMEMHGYHVAVYKTANDELIFEEEEHEHASSFTISKQVTHALSDTTALKLVVEAAGDHEGSTVTKEVHFTYIP